LALSIDIWRVGEKRHQPMEDFLFLYWIYLFSAEELEERYLKKPCDLI